MKINKSTKLPLDKFIELALYDKKSGYYIKKTTFGKDGDFITAPNITRLFSEIIAIWVITFWKSKLYAEFVFPHKSFFMVILCC